MFSINRISTLGYKSTSFHEAKQGRQIALLALRYITIVLILITMVSVPLLRFGVGNAWGQGCQGGSCSYNPGQQDKSAQTGVTLGYITTDGARSVSPNIRPPGSGPIPFGGGLGTNFSGPGSSGGGILGSGRGGGMGGLVGGGIFSGMLGNMQQLIGPLIAALIAQRLLNPQPTSTPQPAYVIVVATPTPTPRPSVISLF
jgi:hypothetical protein